jgi:NADPH:quinone reductase-like Zn-dependent oxidoreductase
MRAVICTRYGPPEVLRLAEVERPTPRRNQVCIRIFATAVRVSDCVVRGLKVPPRYRILFRLLAGVKKPRRSILGMVLAGDVESVGQSRQRAYHLVRDLRNERPAAEAGVFCGQLLGKGACYEQGILGVNHDDRSASRSAGGPCATGARPAGR